MAKDWMRHSGPTPETPSSGVKFLSTQMGVRAPASRTDLTTGMRFPQPHAGFSLSAACGDHSSESQRLKNPAAIAPTNGATQNSHSCSNAQPPTKMAGPVLRAGFTDALVMGMLIK